MDITEWASYRITGSEERRFVVPGAASLPGGTCDHCGTAIVVCICIQHATTGESHIIGADCARKVGMDADEIKRAYRAAQAPRLAAEAAARTAAARTAREAQELEAAGLLGAHGTESRYLSGCMCSDCRGAAPHATFTRFDLGCRCLDCIDAAVTAKPDNYWLSDSFNVLLDLATGRPADAQERYVSNKFTGQGEYKWCLNSDEGTKWLPTAPARRATHAKHGVVEVMAPVLLYSPRVRGEGHKPPQVAAVLGSALLDIWGKPAPRP